MKEGFSFGRERAEEIYLETRKGGRFYERFTDGEEFVVGHVTACEPPRRIVFTWQDPDWEGPTEVEVRFAAEGNARAWKWSTAAGMWGPRRPRQARVTTADGISFWANTPPQHELEQFGERQNRLSTFAQAAYYSAG